MSAFDAQEYCAYTRHIRAQRGNKDSGLRDADALLIIF